MNPEPSVSFLVPAAGCGSRAGLGGNKILAPLSGRPVLFWTLRALLHPASVPPASTCAEIVVAARPEEWALIEAVFDLFDGPERAGLKLVEGGATRQDSVESMARAARGDLVAVHDAARPLIEPQLCARVIRSALEDGAAMAALPASDTVKLAAREGEAAEVGRTLDRKFIWLAQTPQVFGRQDLLRALEVAREHGFQGTDCASLLEHWSAVDPDGGAPRVRLVEGEARNFKITFAPDLERAERELQVLEAEEAAAPDVEGE